MCNYQESWKRGLLQSQNIIYNIIIDSDSIINMISNLLSPIEIADIVNDPIVKINQEKLSTHDKVDFSIPLSDDVVAKLTAAFAIDLSHITSIPMRWIKGDTSPHADKGADHFTNTYLLYLTDSIGNLIIDGQLYPIQAGDAHIFSEGLEHSTIHTGNSERLMIGPMSETGFRVGVPPIVYFNNESDATTDTTNYIGFGYDYELITIDSVSSWMIASNSGGTGPSTGGPYNSGDSLVATGSYYVYPYIAPVTTTEPTNYYRQFNMRNFFTDNSLVFYKPHSLSTGGGGSGVRNSRHKQRKT